MKYEHTLTSEQMIANIEEAPTDMQAAIAKAYLRDDICDDDIQYHFNTDGIDVLVEDGEVENVNEEEIEGIGADGFVMRTTKPNASNKNFIRQASGGWNPCVKGNPKDKNCDVLANCVGYACGRFNEIYNEILGKTGCKWNKLCCNAENFVEKAAAMGLKTGNEPHVGAIMVWQKGSLKSADGAGHVAIVERVNTDGSVYTSESSYGGNAFFNSTRKNTNGRWGMGSAYKFRCFIYQPDEVEKVTCGSAGESAEDHAPAPVQSNPKAPTPTAAALKVGDKVTIIGTGNGSSKGTSGTAYGIGWNRQILKIWDERKFPYQVGNNKGTTGFYKAEALKKR